MRQLYVHFYCCKKTVMHTGESTSTFQEDGDRRRMMAQCQLPSSYSRLLPADFIECVHTFTYVTYFISSHRICLVFSFLPLHDIVCIYFSYLFPFFTHNSNFTFRAKSSGAVKYYHRNIHTTIPIIRNGKLCHLPFSTFLIDFAIFTGANRSAKTKKRERIRIGALPSFPSLAISRSGKCINL